MAPLSEAKQTILAAALRQLFTSKQLNEMVHFLEDAMTNDVCLRWECNQQRPMILYRLFCSLLRTNTPENRQVYLVATVLKNASDVVTKDMIEEALQKCYLDPKAVSSNLNKLADNFLVVVKVFAENELISHVPSFEKTEEETDIKVGEDRDSDYQNSPSEELKKEAVKNSQEEDKASEKTLSEKAKADFKALLDSNLMGEDLGNKAMEMNLEKDPSCQMRNE